jgi:hypothetical protein
MARLVCLANSERPGGQCIAGIDLDTREWIRPVPRDLDAVPMARCIVDDKFLAPLDIIELDYLRPREPSMYQRENRIIRSWNWRIVGRFRKADLPALCDDASPILHTASDRVPPAFLDKLPPVQWSSLQLVRPRRLRFEHDHREQHRWRARFTDAAGNEYFLPITDVGTTRRLGGGVPISPNSILTVSLSKPWTPSDCSKPTLCYKLVAAVMEL